MKISSLVALEVVKMTTSSAAYDENFIKMMTFHLRVNPERAGTELTRFN